MSYSASYANHRLKKTAFGCRRAAIVAALMTLSGLAGCSQAVHAEPPIGGGTLCPNRIQELVDSRQRPDVEIVGLVDGSGSFMGATATGSSAEERARQQVYALARKAVEQRAALHILVFGTTLATVTDAIVCPTMAARYNNVAAQPAKTAYLVDQAEPAVWSAVQAARRSTAGSGTSIVGGWRAASETASLAVDRRVVMLSDGQGRKEQSVPVDLSQFKSVGMYSIGSVAGRPRDTTKTAALVGHWNTWLTKHHATTPVVTSRPFS